jgi:hypothetical protein
VIPEWILLRARQGRCREKSGKTLQCPLAADVRYHVPASEQFIARPERSVRARIRSGKAAEQRLRLNVAQPFTRKVS